MKNLDRKTLAIGVFLYYLDQNRAPVYTWVLDVDDGARCDYVVREVERRGFGVFAITHLYRGVTYTCHVWLDLADHNPYRVFKAMYRVYRTVPGLDYYHLRLGVKRVRVSRDAWGVIRIAGKYSDEEREWEVLHRPLRVSTIWFNAVVTASMIANTYRINPRTVIELGGGVCRDVSWIYQRMRAMCRA